MKDHGCEEASSAPSPSADACEMLAHRLAALMAKQQDCQRSLGVLAEEQEAFLGDMRAFADAHLFRESRAIGRSESRLVSNPEESLLGRTPVITSGGSFHSDVMVYRSTAPSCATPSNAGTSRSVQDCGVRLSVAHLATQLTDLYHSSSTNTGLMYADAFGMFSRARSATKALLYGQYFEIVMGLIILINAANIGWAIEAELRNQDTSVQTLIEIAIVLIFWVELAMVFLVEGCKAFRHMWNVFDFTLNLVTTLVLIIVSIMKEKGIRSTFAEVMKKMIILRMLRLFRLFRAVRIIQMSQSLWKLVQGLKQCLGTMVATVLLISIVFYVFACFGAELITKAYTGDPEIGGIVDRSLSSVPSIMLTLFQFISMDGTSAIYVSLIHRNPWLMIYFLILVVLVTIMLMNLITAVIVEDAITTATMDNELKNQLLRNKLRNVRPSLAELFRNLDANKDGFVQIQEIIAAIDEGIHIPVSLQDMVTPPRMLDLFELLDQDDSGELTEAEFVDGMSCLALSDVPLETMQILHLIRLTRREVMRLACSNEESRAAVNDVASHKSVNRAPWDDDAGELPSMVKSHTVI